MVFMTGNADVSLGVSPAGGMTSTGYVTIA
jgi:hypothetical protein